MGDAVNLPTLLEDHEFISDFARYSEGILDEKFLRRKYQFDNSTWESLGNNDALVELIENERVKRMRNGDSAREKAQQIFVQAPAVLGDILHGEAVSPRHKIESARELRAIAANGPQAVLAADRFQIVINLGGDVIERYDKSRAIDPPNNSIDTTTLAIIATNKQEDDGGGQPL